MTPVGLLTIELHLPECGSLKSKRRVLKSVIERLRARFNVSVAEVGCHDLWQRASIAVAVVSNDWKHSNRVLSKVMDQIGRDAGVQVIDYNLTAL